MTAAGDMMKKPIPSEDVTTYLKKLKHPLKAEVEKLRTVILGADKKITEHIKWNAPSFCYLGDDRITFNLSDKKSVKLIFHRGAKVKDSSKFEFEDPTELLEWLAADRAVIKIHSASEANAIKSDLVKVVKKWLKATVDK